MDWTHERKQMKFSDHKKPQHSIFDLLPEVYRSNVNQSVFNTAFDRNLTKDDTSRITGFVGETNASAVVDRRIKEATPHRQAFQLAPTMVSSAGTETYALSQSAFLAQLELMGVDRDRLPVWGSTTQFNWAPPVNIDMIVNYQDYFWRPTDPGSHPQYLTIENRCNKATSTVGSYQNMINQRGETIAVKSINHATSELVVDMKFDDLFVPGFILYTKDSTNVNMQNKWWTVTESSYNSATGDTTLVVESPSGNPLAPIRTSDRLSSDPGAFNGEWYYNEATVKLMAWNQTTSTWEHISTIISLNISLVERLTVFKAQANCACSGDLGWDIAQWDDNPLLWNDDLLSDITHPTFTDWVNVNGYPENDPNSTSGKSLWYDTTTDTLKQRDIPLTAVISASTPLTPSVSDLWFDTTVEQLKEYTGSGTLWITVGDGWTTVMSDFSMVIAQTTGTSYWDANTACDPQQLNQWSTQNQWVHKSELTSTSGATRAALPILEYDSTAEMNEWVKATYNWKYRANTDYSFEYVDVGPSRLELEPIKGYYATYTGTEWIMYLFHNASTSNRDVDYSDTFVPGYQFRITDDTLNMTVYTVSTVEYREITPTSDSFDPGIYATVGVGNSVMCTIISLEEGIFNNIPIAGDSADTQHTRIEPMSTSHGHAWTGYHAHWVLDDENITFSPVAHQRWNYYRQISLDNATALTPGAIPEFPATFSAGVVGIAHQEYTVGTSTTTTIELHPTLIYSDVTPQMFAVPNSNEIRVYVNDVRQYGNYTETTTVGFPNYTIVGDDVYITQRIDYVTGVVFNQPLNQFDVVRIEVGPAPFNCMGNNAIPVRTVEDETAFTMSVAAGTQPVYRSMTQCYNLEQSKTALNQYPLFNIYDVSTSAVIAANSTFGYKEDPSSPVNSSIQRRILTSSDGKDFTFEQYLRSINTEEIYAYKTFRPTKDYWYSPTLNQAFNWNGYAWSDRVIVSVSSGTAVRRIVVSDTQPTTTQDKSIWFDTNTRTLYQYDIIGEDWGLNTTDITISETDPLLRTVWRRGLNNEQYVPSYVNAVLEEVPVGSVDGDWEVVDQWLYNSEHKNYNEVSYTQLVTHLRSIINSQPSISGLQTGGVYTLTQSEYNYALGGTIKEHNDGFDTLISAVNVTNVTPIGVIEFASQEYASSILRIRDTLNHNVVDYLSDYNNKASYVDIASGISEQVIALHEDNDYTAQLYGDTTAYNDITGKGIKNWIATVPMLALGEKYQPFISIEDGVAHILHHDGHRSTISYTPAEFDRLARSICSTPDVRVDGGTLGVVNSAPAPVNVPNFIAAFGGTNVRAGVYWYNASTNRKLYRFQAYDISFVPPSYYDSLGNELPDGVLYFDKNTNTVFIKDGMAWVQHSPIGDISALWVEISFASILAETVLDIEQRLYDVTPDRDLVFDYTTLTSEPLVLAEYTKHRFDDYVASRDIVAPLVNVEYNASDAFTWNYTQSVIDSGDMPRFVSAVETPVNTPYAAGCWQALYTNIYGTPYPHLEPWVLQGFTDKPTWWDSEYADITGTRRWKASMWTDILAGSTPYGNPGGIVPTYTYVSVNITTDALLPPYSSTMIMAPNRSLFTDYNSQIADPSADYEFGDVGPTEWSWTVSAQYPYDPAVIAFLMQPAKFLHASFGPTYTQIDGLQVDMLSKRVYSHEGALFHGDVYNDTEQYSVNGLNQWYVNYNRYTGFDTNTEFREQWVNWTPHMTYQFGGIVDTSSFDIGNKYFDITDQDYDVLLVNGGVIDDVWADAFEIVLLNIPPAATQYNNQALWKVEIDSLASIARSISYYGVRHYETTVDVNTDTFTIDITIPWVTGDSVVMSSSKFLPAPLKPDTAYYIIRESNNTFKLAETSYLAASNTAIDIVSIGDGVIHVSQLESSFNVFGGYGNTAELWFHYAVDRNDVRTFTPPQTINGMQTLINLLDGYAVYQADTGVKNTGTEANDFDPTTGRLVEWNLETERFIDWAFGLRQSRVRISDKYETSVNVSNSQFTFTNMTPTWLSGTAVFASTTGSLPAPLIDNSPYYIVSTGTVGTFKLSLSANPLDTTSHITLSSAGSGQLYIGLYDTQRAYPRFEVNPYRNNISIDTPLGMLSNVVEGPYTDIRVQQTIFDQYSRPLTPDQLTVYRQDLRSRIAVRPEISNDVDKIYTDDPYNYVHIGGGHFFIEGYEHFLIFEDYTTGGALIYDQFLGLWSKRFSLDYFEKTDYTLRPTLGGYYLIDGKFERNLEGAVGDMQQYYDTVGLSDTSDVAIRARNILGFKGRTTFLDLLNVNATSQFMFYRGMIQSKGSINSVKAYINSRRFVDAKIDEFWAWKIAEFGDSRRRVYPEVNVFASDTLVDDLRFEFLAQSELASDPDVVDSVNKGFNVVSYSTPERWNGFLEQKTEIGSPLFLDAEISTVKTIYTGQSAPEPIPDQSDLSNTIYGKIDYWYDTDEDTIKIFNGTVWALDTLNDIIFQTIDIDSVDTNVLYFHHGDVCDDVRVIRRIIDAPILEVVNTPDDYKDDFTPHDYTTDIIEPGTGTSTVTKINSEVIRLYVDDLNTQIPERPTMVSVYTINPAKSKISPAKLIDKTTGAVVQQLPLWHPAKGHHSHVAIHNVDMQLSIDPARYNTTVDISMSDSNNWGENFWNETEVGTTWFDTSKVGYMPYYDDKIVPNINDRLYMWGTLAPWSEIRVYEWVQSTTAPSEWAGTGIPRSSTFYRTREASVEATFDVTDRVTIASVDYVAGDDIVFVTDIGTLPPELDSTTKYTLHGTTTTGEYTLIDTLTGEAITIATPNDSTAVQVIKSFSADDWREHIFVHDRLSAPQLMFNLGLPTPDYDVPIDEIIWTPATTSMWYVDGELSAESSVDVYVNGKLMYSGLTVVENAGVFNIDISSQPLVLNEYDLIDIIRPTHVLTSTETAFDPDLDDDGTQLIQWKLDYQYSANERLADETNVNSTTSSPFYYFWVEQSAERLDDTTRMSTAAIATQLQDIPTPYLIVQRPKDAPILLERYGYDIPPYDTAYSLGALSEYSYLVPVLYREAIVRGVSYYITDDDRHAVRFTCDHTLRDEVSSSTAMLKNKHQEWMLFRKSQMSTIPRELWDKLTEALIGYKLTDHTIRVPTLDRTLYDATYETDTQYGLGIDQSFVNAAMGLATVIAYLQDPTHDFSPTSVDAFFDTHSFNTPSEIEESMNVIYNTFSSEHVNAIWFSVLDDSLSLRAKYKELMKTSWVALHGIRVLETNGMFDD